MIKQRNISLIVVHCTASRCTSDLTPESLDAMHKRQGFTECGYHYYITKDGTIHHMRDITRIGAHAKGYNTPSIGVAYEGGLDASGRAADTRTAKQKQSLETILRFLLLTYPGAKICGHRDLSPDLNHNGTIEPCEYIKQCPCFDAAAEYGEKLRMESDHAVYKRMKAQRGSALHSPFSVYTFLCGEMSANERRTELDCVIPNAADIQFIEQLKRRSL